MPLPVPRPLTSFTFSAAQTALPQHQDPSRAGPPLSRSLRVRHGYLANPSCMIIHYARRLRSARTCNLPGSLSLTPSALSRPRQRPGTAPAGCRQAGRGSADRRRCVPEGFLPSGLKGSGQLVAHPLRGMGPRSAPGLASPPGRSATLEITSRGQPCHTRQRPAISHGHPHTLHFGREQALGLIAEQGLDSATDHPS